MIQVTSKIEEEIKAHAALESPKECCGLVIVKRGKQAYIPCRNIATSGKDFVISPEDYYKAEDGGEVILIVHSHPYSSPKPSPVDLVECEKHGLPWLIVNHPVGTMYQFDPTGFVTPLIGREFHHGVLDCYTFIRDYYNQVLDIKLLEFDRADNWWLAGDNLYIDNFNSTGFEAVTGKIQEHDVLLMQVASQVPNHGAIYVGGGKIEHHQTQRLSSRDVYGGWYQKITTHILRHKAIK